MNQMRQKEHDRIVRQHHYDHLTTLFILLIYQRPFQLFISDVGGLYKPDYIELDTPIAMCEYQFAFVKLDNKMFSLGMLSGWHIGDSTFNFTEVPIAFSRQKTRKLKVSTKQIICIMLPCSKK